MELVRPASTSSRWRRARSSRPGRVKVIQPLETGKIAAIQVENGRHVAAGDRADGDRSGRRARRRGRRPGRVSTPFAPRRCAAAPRSRRRGERKLDPAPAIAWDADMPADRSAQREDAACWTATCAQLADAVADFDAQIGQKQVERDRATKPWRRRAKLIATLAGARGHARLAGEVRLGREAGADRRAGEPCEYHKTQLAMQKGQRDAAAANRRRARSASATRPFPISSPKTRKNWRRRSGRPTTGAKSSPRPS